MLFAMERKPLLNWRIYYKIESTADNGHWCNWFRFLSKTENTHSNVKGKSFRYDDEEGKKDKTKYRPGFVNNWYAINVLNIRMLFGSNIIEIFLENRYGFDNLHNNENWVDKRMIDLKNVCISHLFFSMSLFWEPESHLFNIDKI